MTATTMLHVRMDQDLKARATSALEAIGLSASDAVRILFKRIVAEQAFPLELKVPNAETIAAMAEAEEIMAAHRKRWGVEEGAIAHPPTPRRRPVRGGPNAETIAALEEVEERIAARKLRFARGAEKPASLE